MEADGVVSADLLEADLHAVDVAAVDFGTVADLGEVAFGFGEDGEKFGFELGSGLAEELARELEDTASVGDDLHGLDAGDLVEEPAAGGVHELSVAFELEEFEGGCAFWLGERACGLLLEETDDGGRGAIEDDLDVGVASGPEIFEERLGELFGEGRGGVAEVVESFTKRGAPLLIPAGLASAVAAAVGAPALDAMHAGPGGVFRDFGLPFGREFFEELAVVGEAGLAGVFDPVHGVGEGHLAVLVMVAVALAVGGDVRDLRGFGIAGRGWVEGEETFGEVFAAVEEPFEGDGAGAGTVVEEDVDGAAFIEADKIGVGGVDGGVGGFGPGSFGSGLGIGGEDADAGALDGGQDREFNAFLSHEVENVTVGCGFGEPHAFGFAAVAGFEVGDAPADLGEGVAVIGKRHDDVVVDLSHRGAVSAVTLRADFVGVEDHAVGAGGFVLKPTEEGRAEVVAHPGVVVHDADDFVFFIGDAGGAVRGVTLGGDAVVPVVVRGGGVLDLDGFEPGVLAWGLVEMAVDADEARSFGGGLATWILLRREVWP